MKTNAFLIAEEDRGMSSMKQYASKSIEVYIGGLTRHNKETIRMSTIYNLELGLEISCINNHTEIRKLLDSYAAQKTNSDYTDAMVKDIFMEQLADIPYAELLKAIDKVKRDSLRQGRREKLDEIKKAMEIY